MQHISSQREYFNHSAAHTCGNRQGIFRGVECPNVLYFEQERLRIGQTVGAYRIGRTDDLTTIAVV